MAHQVDLHSAGEQFGQFRIQRPSLRFRFNRRRPQRRAGNVDRAQFLRLIGQLFDEQAPTDFGGQPRRGARQRATQVARINPDSFAGWRLGVNNPVRGTGGMPARFCDRPGLTKADPPATAGANLQPVGWLADRPGQHLKQADPVQSGIVGPGQTHRECHSGANRGELARTHPDRYGRDSRVRLRQDLPQQGAQIGGI